MGLESGTAATSCPVGGEAKLFLRTPRLAVTWAKS